MLIVIQKMPNEIIIPASAELLAADTTVFSEFLSSFGLPSDNVIATDSERRIIAQNLPVFLNSLAPEEKKDARYLSKFVGASAIGLFDAGLNYVWNEVILNLQRKAVIYGLDLFFDAAVGGDRRELYSSEDDFRSLKDRVIIDTFRKLELISHVVYQKLEHILTMRNEVAASHPNVEQIGGYELLGWLQTCVKEVLQDRMSDSAIQISSMVSNLKQRTDPLDVGTIERFNIESENLAPAHVHNLLITIFGIFIADGTGTALRANIATIAPKIWSLSAESVKYRIGSRVDGFRTNLQQQKLEKSIEFLSVVDGLNFESLPQREITLNKLSARLLETHFAWDNFHNEPPVMKEILSYIKRSEDIPSACLNGLCRAVLRCRIGNGVSYSGGVSSGGRAHYEKFLGLLDDTGVHECLILLGTPELLQKLSHKQCSQHLPAVISSLRENLISDRLKSALDMLEGRLESPGHVIVSREFKEVLHPIRRG
jgi:hypothetical protein